MAVRKLRDRWWVDIRFAGKRYRKKSPLDTKGGAQAYETLLRGELASRGTLDAVTPPTERPLPVTFAAFAERWMREYAAVENKWSEQRSKRKILDAYLLPELGKLALAEITAARIDQLKARLREQRTAQRANGVCAKTINNVLTVLRRCLATAVDWGELDQVPIVRRLRVPPAGFRFLCATEADTLIAAAEPGTWRTMVLTALKTGLRYSELAGLRWDDIDLERRLLVVRRAKVLGRIDSPKSGRIRHVPITSDVAAALVATARPDGVVFDHIDTYRQASRALARFSRAAGLAPVGWHTLRHTFASRLVAAGVPIRAVQDLLGHASIQMTMRYAHLGPQELRGAIDVLEPDRMGNRWATPATNAPEPVALVQANAAQQSQDHRVEAVV